MANRNGEFVLVIDPDNDMHLVEADFLWSVTVALESLISAGFVAIHGHGTPPPRLYHTASPELGSVRFWLIAASAISITADIVQIAGVSVKDVFEALNSAVASPAAAAPQIGEGAARCLADPAYIDGVSKLLGAASRAGYRSVRIEDPVCPTIELRAHPSPPSEVVELEAREHFLLRELRAIDVRLADAMTENHQQVIVDYTERRGTILRELERVRSARRSLEGHTSEAGN